MDIKTIEQAGKILNEQGLYTIIAGIFLIGVVIGSVFLLNKIFALYTDLIGVQGKASAELANALNASREAIEDNTEIYKGVREQHEVLDAGVKQILINTGNIADIQEQIKNLDKSITDLNDHLRRSLDDNKQIIGLLNKMIFDYKLLKKEVTQEIQATDKEE